MKTKEIMKEFDTLNVMKQKLYTKNEKGMYEEYVEPVQEYDNKLYRKVGKKYEPCSMLMTDELPEGVWVITKHYDSRQTSNGKYLLKNFQCYKASDIQEVSLAKLGGMEKLAYYLSQHLEELPKTCSRHELCEAIVGMLFNYENDKEE